MCCKCDGFLTMQYFYEKCKMEKKGDLFYGYCEIISTAYASLNANAILRCIVNDRIVHRFTVFFVSDVVPKTFNSFS